MDKKNAALTIKEKIFSKLSQTQNDDQQKSSSNVIDVGSGIPFFKPLSGQQTLAFSVTPITAEKVATEVDNFLHSLGYSYNTKFDPKNYEFLAHLIANHLRQVYGEQLQYVNPEYLK